MDYKQSNATHHHYRFVEPDLVYNARLNDNKMHKINRLKDEIAAGKYRINTLRIAAKLMRHELFR